MAPLGNPAQLQFDSSIPGHEDTLFGQVLEIAGVHIMHLDNPLEHLGLDNAAAFLEKVNQSVENLARLQRSGLRISTRLTASAALLEQWRVEPLFRFALTMLEPVLIRNLLSRTPKLWVLDLYKLSRFLQDRQGILLPNTHCRTGDNRF